MRYQLKTRVHSDSFAKQKLVVEEGDFLITFFTQTPDEKVLETFKFENWITVSVRIEDYSDFLPKFKLHADGHGKHSLTIRTPIGIRDKMIEMLHYLESIGGFCFGIKSMDIDGLEEKWVSESDEEQKELDILNFNLKKSYKQSPTELSFDSFKRKISEKIKFEYLTVPLKFYLMGKEAFDEFNYYVAYLNLFLFLEALFGKGKFKRRDLKESFKDQVVLLRAIDMIISFLQSKKNSAKREELQIYFESRGKDIDDREDIIDFVIDTRGDLAHFTVKRKNQLIDLKDQSKFQPVSFLILAICTYAVSQLTSDHSLRDQIVS